MAEHVIALEKTLAESGEKREVVKIKQRGIVGTCAGLVLLAKEGDEEVVKTKQPLLGLMDVKVKRNAFGRQRESFETLLKLTIFETPFHAVFIFSSGTHG